MDEAPPSLAKSPIDAQSQSDVTVSVTDRFDVSESISVAKTRASMDFEARALAWGDKWPELLRTTLDFNYLAATSHEEIPRFISLCSALEVLTTGLCGEPEPALSGFHQMKQLKRELRKVLERFGLRKDFIERAAGQLKSTPAKSQIDRMATALRMVGVTASKKEITLVTRRRGAVVHAGSSSNEADVRYALALTMCWDQTGLRNVLERTLDPIPSPELPE